MTLDLVAMVSAGALALLGLWPFGPYQLTLLAARALFGPRSVRPPFRPEVGAPATFALCVCAHNEEAVIEQKIRNLLDIKETAGGGVEILIYCDGCTDRTVEIARRFEPDVKVFVSEERRGKIYGMNVLADAAASAVLVFTDADIVVDRELVRVLRRYFGDPQVGCVDVPLKHTNPDATPTTEVGTTYFRFEGWTKQLESDTGSLIGSTGGCYALRRDLYRRLSPGLCDDLHVSMSVLVQGFRVVRASGVHSYEAHPTLAEEEFRRRVRQTTQALHSHRVLWPELRRLGAWNLYKYFSHRLLRWFSGWCLLVASLLVLVVACRTFGLAPVVLTVTGGAAAFASARALRVKLADRLWSALVALAGTSFGVIMGLRGHRAVTWEGARSSRRAVLPP
ncbi:MAG: glycosyltransferase [Geminicoccaceae bacterium]|nr:glycosyltransferase [Geminicoccaceae bacterium]MDW8342086.1 glycosyltransferase [Geminicoccaceae bacterium]